MINNLYLVYCENCCKEQPHKPYTISKLKGIRLSCLVCNRKTGFHNLKFLKLYERGLKNGTGTTGKQ